MCHFPDKISPGWNLDTLQSRNKYVIIFNSILRWIFLKGCCQVIWSALKVEQWTFLNYKIVTMNMNYRTPEIYRTSLRFREDIYVLYNLGCRNSTNDLLCHCLSCECIQRYTANKSIMRYFLNRKRIFLQIEISVNWTC